MNRRGGIFGFAIMLVIIVMLVWIWSIITPAAITPSITTTLDATSTDPYADGIGFFLRMIPWMVPLILIIGLLWVGATS